VITGKTKLLGVIGYPIEHSLSPIMHNAALAALQQEHPELEFAYLPFAIRPEDLAAAIAGFQAISLQGFNITIPHKLAIMPFLSEVTPLARMVGAVNTVWATPQGWSGTNTDVLGFLAPLLSLQRDWSQSNLMILGHGGAARAVVVAASELGCARVHVLGRNLDRLKQFQQSWLEVLPGLNLQINLWEDLADLLPSTHLVVNTTPLGMVPAVDQTPIDAEGIGLLPSDAIVYDLVYTPNPTLLLLFAKQRGLLAINGLEMLVQQGAAALEIWLKQPAPVDVMRQAALQRLFPTNVPS
jgi:shikimate dehydrogenase